MHADWKKKLEHWAPEPPASVWERVSEKLEAAEQTALAKRLHDFDTAPPPETWNKIASRLQPTTPVVRLLPRNLFVRYGSVAASFLLFFFMFRHFNTADTGRGATRSPVQQQSVFPLPDASPAARADTHASKETPASGNSITALPAQPMAFIPKMPTPHIPKDPLPIARTERNKNIRLYEVVPAAAPELNDGYVERYIVLAVAEDAAVRLPKKLYDLFQCSDRPLPSECAELIGRMQRQSAAPSLPASTDFAGLLETVRQVAQWQ